MVGSAVVQTRGHAGARPPARGSVFVVDHFARLRQEFLENSPGDRVIV